MSFKPALLGYALITLGSSGCRYDSAGTSPPAPPPTPDLAKREGCNPVGMGHCLYPFPNMMLLAEDAGTATGYRVSIPADLFGFATTGADELSAFLAAADGFSPGTPMLAQLGGARVDADLLPGAFDIERSLAADAPIRLYDMETGERVPLWAEVDRRASTADRTTLIIRQQRALRPGARHLVAILRTLRAEDGSELSSTPAFEALRDDRPSDDADTEALRPSYEEMFDFLGDDGVAREDLLLAWDFVTFSKRSLVDRTQLLVDEGARLFAEADVSFTVTSCVTSIVTEELTHGCTYDADLPPTVWRRVGGTFSAPSFLDPASARITWSADGKPIAHGTQEAEFLALIPRSLLDRPSGSAPLTVFGHGFLKDPAYYLAHPQDANGMQTLADRLGYVFVGTRWLGLSDQDLELAASAVTDFAKFGVMSDRLAQGMVNQNLVRAFVHRALAADSRLAAATGGPLINPEHTVYMGVSLGGVFGTTLMALNREIRTGVLHVPTAMFSHILQHSDLFTPFQALLDARVPDPIDQQIILALIQRVFDPVDPINFAIHIQEEPLTALGPKNCLWQVNWADTSASDFGAYALARSAGAPLLMPTPHDIPGLSTLEMQDEPVGSGLALYDPGFERVPLLNDSGEQGNAAHAATRRNPEVHGQIEAFFAPETEGMMTNTCDGACNVTPTPVGEATSYP